MAAFGDVERVGLPGFRQVFEAVTAGGGGGRGGPDREQRQRDGPRELRPAARARPRAPGRGRRAGPAVPRRAARRAARRDRAGLLAHPGARPGGGVPAHPAVGAADDLQHGRRRPAHRRSCRSAARRRCCRRAPPALFGLEILADGIQDVDRQPDAVPRGRAARGRLPPLAPGDRRATTMRRRSCWRSATSRGRCSGCSRSSPSMRLNMSTIESRPSRERAWEYVFWVDLDVIERSRRPWPRSTGSARSRR